MDIDYGPRNAVEQALFDYAATIRDRDARVRSAYRAGVLKSRIHVLTGIARNTIDAILEPRDPDGSARHNQLYVVTARHAGTVSQYAVDADDATEAAQLAQAALDEGYHHASIKRFGPVAGQYSEVDSLTRPPRVHDHIVGRENPDADEIVGVVDTIEGDRYRLAEGALVTFVRFDAQAVPGIHFRPDDLRRVH
jgi:hypothetical protein